MTGGTGFLGRHIAAAAAGDGCEVICLTRLARGRPGELALASPWSRASLKDTLTRVRPEVVVHCAGATHTQDARDCFETNTVIAAELLGAAGAIANPPRIVLIGSAAEYGTVSARHQPVCETHACEPVTDYGVAKYAQTLLGAAAARRGLPVLTVRLFNPVGVGMPPRLALPSFARQLVGPEAKAVLRVGNVSVQRDFIGVEEAARIVIALARMEKWPWPLINLASGRLYKIGSLLETMVALSNATVRIETDPVLVRPDEMPTLVGSTRRLVSIGLAPNPPEFEAILPGLLEEARVVRDGHSGRSLSHHGRDSEAQVL